MLKYSFQLIVFCFFCRVGAADVREWQAEILPLQNLVHTDSSSGRCFTILSTWPSREVLLPCPHNAFLADGSMVVFSSDHSGLNAYYGYLIASGELVKFLPDAVSNAYGAVVSRKQNVMYLLRKRSILAWNILCTGNGNSRHVRIQEKKLGEIPEGYSLLESMSESGDATCLSLLLQDQVDEPAIALFFIESGELRFLARGLDRASRLQFNPNDANVLLYAGGDHPCRLDVLDASGQPPRMLLALDEGASVKNLQWCSDGRIALLTSAASGEPQLYFIHAASGIKGPPLFNGLGLASCCVSPDNRRIAGLGRNGDLLLTDLEGGNPATIKAGDPAAGGECMSQLTWDPQGKFILFSSTILGNPDAGLLDVRTITGQ
jgi:hypothetical protein